MKYRRLQERMIEPYRQALLEAEKSPATIEKYLHAIRRFVADSEGRKINKALVLDYKRELGERYAASSANADLAAVNGFLRFWGFGDCCVRPFRI